MHTICSINPRHILGMMYLRMINLFDIFKKDKKIVVEVVNANNPITDHIKENIGKFQVIFSPSRKFIWFKNAKVAGTSMYRGIMKREILDLVSYKDNPTEFDQWWDNLTDRELKKYFKFTFVRNPFDRLLSAFSHIIIEGTVNGYYRDMELIEVGSVEDRIVNERGVLDMKFDHMYLLFSLFIMRVLPDYDINKKSVHWMPQNILSHYNKKPIVDFIGKYENLANDWRYVADKIQVNTTLPFVSSSKSQKVTNKTRQEMYKVHWKGYYFSNEIVSAILDYYPEDFDLLGYRPVALALQQRIKIRRDLLDAKHNS